RRTDRRAVWAKRSFDAQSPPVQAPVRSARRQKQRDQTLAVKMMWYVATSELVFELAPAAAHVVHRDPQLYGPAYYRPVQELVGAQVLGCQPRPGSPEVDAPLVVREQSCGDDLSVMPHPQGDQAIDGDEVAEERA